MPRFRETNLLRGSGCRARLLRDWLSGGDLARRLGSLWPERGAPFRSACRLAGLEPEAVDVFLWHRRRTLDAGRTWPTPGQVRELIEGIKARARFRRGEFTRFDSGTPAAAGDGVSRAAFTRKKTRIS